MRIKLFNGSININLNTQRIRVKIPYLNPVEPVNPIPTTAVHYYVDGVEDEPVNYYVDGVISDYVLYVTV